MQRRDIGADATNRPGNPDTRSRALGRDMALWSSRLDDTPACCVLEQLSLFYIRAARTAFIPKSESARIPPHPNQLTFQRILAFNSLYTETLIHCLIHDHFCKLKLPLKT